MLRFIVDAFTGPHHRWHLINITACRREPAAILEATNRISVHKIIDIPHVRNTYSMHHSSPRYSRQAIMVHS